MGSLHDPERCPACEGRGRVIESRHEGEYRRRRRKCDNCGQTWPTYESVLNVQPVISRAQKRRAVEPTATAPPTPAPPPAQTSAASVVTRPTRSRRVSRSSYLGGS